MAAGAATASGRFGLSVRVVSRFLVLLFASYGPLAPAMLLFLLAMPALIALSGWPWWIDLTFALAECGLIVGAAIWLGPGALAAARAFFEEQREGESPPPPS